MVTAEHVQRVARTGCTLRMNGGEMTADKIVRLTSAADWEGTLYELRPEAAQQLADQFNRAHPDRGPEFVQEAAVRGEPVALPTRPRLALVAAS